MDETQLLIYNRQMVIYRTEFYCTGVLTVSILTDSLLGFGRDDDLVTKKEIIK